MTPKYPNIRIPLMQYGTSFTVVIRVEQALKDNNVPQYEINQFLNDAIGDWSEQLTACKK